MHDWAALLGEWPEQVPTGFNVSPTTQIPVFTASGGSGMRWGLIPVWAHVIAGKYSTFNARIETVDSKPAFKHAWLQSQRCLIPAQGYYEWRSEQGAKQPYFVSLPDSLPLVMAGLYEPARDEFPASCSILTRDAAGHMAKLHNRVPVILPIQLAARWFAASPQAAMQISTADYALPLAFRPVSKRVNNARNDDSGLLDPVSDGSAVL